MFASVPAPPPFSRALRDTLKDALPSVRVVGIETVTAIAAHLAQRVLIDEHFSTGERIRIQGAVQSAPGLGEAVALTVLALIEKHGPELLRLPRRWVRFLLFAWCAAQHDHLERYNSPTILARASNGHGNDGDIGATFLSQVDIDLPVLSESASVFRVTADAVEYDRSAIRIGQPGLANMSSFEVVWPKLLSVEATDPWPGLLLEWRERGQISSRKVGPRKGEEEALDEKIAALIAFARDPRDSPRIPNTEIKAGWVDWPEVEWEPTETWPDDPVTPESSGSPYRHAPTPSERVLARRVRPGALGALLTWLASSPDKPWRQTVAAAVVTDAFLYARLRDGSAGRLSLSALRGRRGGSDAKYLFGRRMEVLLTDRDVCPVARVLDRFLAGDDATAILKATTDDA